MNPGIGSMLHYLSGGSEHNSDEYYGKIIKSAMLDQENNRFKIEFDDGIIINIWDDGQSCCESRYITCDDNPEDLNGGELLRIETKAGPETEDYWGDCHEQVFIEIQTNKGFITFTTHNEHNGYYGGFGLTITEQA